MRKVATVLPWVLVIIAPFLLHLGTGDFRPAWGGRVESGVVVSAILGTAALASFLGIRGVQRGMPTERGWGYFSLVVVIVLLLTPVVAVLLFSLVHMYAAVLALPYAVAIVGGWAERWGKNGFR